MRARAILVAASIFRPADSGRTEYVLGHHLHPGHGAADGKDRHRFAELDLAFGALGRRGGGNEGADLEAALASRNSRSHFSLIFPLSGVAGQCEMPPVATSAIRSGTASAAARSASPNAQARFKGVSGGPWQLMLAGMIGRSWSGVRKCSGTE